MPLNEKGNKILASMEKRYGKKKGKTVFYAMENSGKLKGIKASKGLMVKKFAGGGMDASQPDFGVSTPSPGDTGGAGGFDGSTRQFGQVGSSPTSTGGPNAQIQARTGPAQLPPIGPLSIGFNLISKSLYNRKNLKEAREEDVLGGEMLTTGQKKVAQATLDRGNNNMQLCPDGTKPPCKTPATQTFYNGGEVIISSNVDKDLL